MSRHHRSDAPLSLPPGLTEAILERTSGSVCGRARDLLVRDERSAATTGRPDRHATSAALDQELLDGHLEGCPTCRAVDAALGTLPVDLALWAEIPPPVDLVAAVVAKTSARPQSQRVSDLVRRRWTEIVLGRSRLAWEVGYIGALLLWVVFGASWAPLAAAPSRALAVVQENHVSDVVESVTAIFRRSIEE